MTLLYYMINRTRILGEIIVSMILLHDMINRRVIIIMVDHL